MRQSLLGALLAAVALTAIGCSGSGGRRRERRDIELQDLGSFYPALGGTIRILPGNDRTLRDLIAAEKPMSDLVRENFRRNRELMPQGFSVAVDFDVSGARGTASQNVHELRYVETEDGEFDGPYRLRARYVLERAWMTGRLGYWIPQQWVFEMVGGVGYVRQTLDAEGGAGLRIDDSNEFTELFYGARISFYPVRAIGLYTQLTIGKLESDTDLNTVELGVLLGPIPGVVLQVGYRYWRYLEGNDRRSDVTLDLGGVLAGLRFEF